MAQAKLVRLMVVICLRPAGQETAIDWSGFGPLLACKSPRLDLVGPTL
jgi:hypothetical protein